MAFDPLQIASVEDRPDLPELNTYAVAASELYPPTIARIGEVLEAGGIPQELVDPDPPIGVSREQGALRLLSNARRVPAGAWEDALVSRDEVNGAERLEARAQALEVARHWFTRALHMSTGGGGLNLHILNNGPEDAAYRL